MTPFDIFDAIDRLRRAGQPFCVATVVRTADATSAKAGAKAAVTPEGIEGHLGGACVTRAVRKAAAAALQSGQPQLIRVKPRGAESGEVVALAEGMTFFDSGCPSGGTADILIEPYLPPPMLAVIGGTPIAEAVAAQGRLLGLRVEPADPEGLVALAPSAADFVVIASQGRGDGAALRAALESGAGHVQMIASARKAAVLRERLIAAGVPAAAFERLTAPAGLKLGAVDPQEIALSVLAQIVRWRRARDGGTAARDAV